MSKWIAWPWPLTSSNNIVHVNGSQSVRCLMLAFGIKLLTRSFATHLISDGKIKNVPNSERKRRPKMKNQRNTEGIENCYSVLSRDEFLSMRQVGSTGLVAKEPDALCTIYTSKWCFHFHGNLYFYFGRSIFQNAFVILIYLQVLSDECEWVLNVIAKNARERARAQARQ